MTKATRARYTLEFKQEAVLLVESGQSIAAASRALGLVEQTLFNWVKADREGTLEGCREPVEGDRRADGDQPPASRAGAGDHGERDILGKAMAYLCQGAEVKYASIRRHRRVWPDPRAVPDARGKRGWLS